MGDFLRNLISSGAAALNPAQQPPGGESYNNSIGFIGDFLSSNGQGIAAALGGTAQQNNIGIGTGIGNFVGSVLNKATGLKDLTSSPVGAVADIASAGLAKAFGKDTNYDDLGGQIFSQATGVIKKLWPVGLAAGTVLDLVNAFGSRTYEGTVTDTLNTNEVAGSYNTGNYEMDDANISGFGRLIGSGKRFNRKKDAMQLKLDTIADIGKESRDDNLRAQGSTGFISMRNEMANKGGFRPISVENGGKLVDWDYLRRIRKKIQSMQEGGTVKNNEMPLDFVERLEVQNGTKGTIGKDSEQQGSKTKQATANQIKESQKESNSLNLGMDNLLKLYGNGVLKAQDGLKLPVTKMSMKEFFNILKNQGKWTDTYDYERFYLDDDAFEEWMDEEEEKGYGKGHFTDKYKKPGHVTYSSESIITVPGKKGGSWSYENGEEYFTPEDWQIDQFGGWSKYVEAFEREYGKGESRRIRKKATVRQYFTGPSNGVVKHRNGGMINVIPSGALHKERHRMEKHIDGMEHVTTKGIPVVSINKAGEMKQQAEIERDEIILNKELTDKLDDMKKKFNEAESVEERNQIALEAGKLLASQIMENTVDNTGIIKKTRA